MVIHLAQASSNYTVRQSKVQQEFYQCYLCCHTELLGPNESRRSAQEKEVPRRGTWFRLLKHASTAVLLWSSTVASDCLFLMLKKTMKMMSF